MLMKRTVTSAKIFPSNFKDKMFKGAMSRTAHARQERDNLKRLAQYFQVLQMDLYSEFFALNLGHPGIFFAINSFVIYNIFLLSSYLFFFSGSDNYGLISPD